MNRAMGTGLLAIVLIASSNLLLAQITDEEETDASNLDQQSEPECGNNPASCEHGGLTEIAEGINMDTDANVEPDASYALGVRFQQDVASKYEKMNYRQFLLGALRQAKGNQNIPAAELEKELDNHLLNIREKSERFIRNFVEDEDVRELNGIFRIDRSYLPKKKQSINCKDKDNVKEYHLAFKRLKFDDAIPETVVPDQWKCGSYDGSEVIRGWRTALREMKEGDLWELAIPSAQAYGNEGTSGVKSGEALRFLLMMKRKKPE